MIKCKPERNPRQAIIMVAVCAVVFLGVSLVSSTIEEFKWASQAVSLASITIGIFLVYRYTMVEMIYSIGDGNFSVIKKVGNKETPVCSLDISTAKALITKNDFKKAEKNRTYIVTKKLNFNQNMRPANSYVYITEFNGNVYAIEFEPNEPFVKAFCNEIENAKKDQT